MRLDCVWIPLIVVGLGVGTALGQQGAAVQLPTYSYFGTSTTVSVPDRGSAYLGGVNRARTGRNEFGTPLLPFKNRAFGTERRASGGWASVYIHDFEAMDQHLLSQPTRFRAQQQRLAALAPRIGGRPAPAKDAWHKRLATARAGSGGRAVPSVAQLRAQHLREEQGQEQEASKWLQRGRGAEAAGKANVARVYYQMALRRATGPLKEEVALRLASLGGSPAVPKLAQSRPGNALRP